MLRILRWQAEAVLWETLGSILDAGLAPDRALALAAEPAGGATARIARAAALRVGHGEPLSQALLASGADPLACAVIRAGETTGRLPPLLRRLGEAYRLRARLRDETVSRLVYPAILVHFALFVLPLPMVVAGSAPLWAMLLGPLGLWALLGGLLIVGVSSKRSGLLGRLALVKPLSFLCWPALAADLASVLGAAFTSGMLASDALELAADACANRLLAGRLREAAAGLRARRQPDLASALAEVGLAGDLLELIRTGEASGRLEQACEQVRTIAGERFSWRLQWTGKVTTGVCYGTAMLIAALAVFSMYGQVYSGLTNGLAE
jgi:type II secretory pathway component PulF